jgi:hypothetical protein
MGNRRVGPGSDGNFKVEVDGIHFFPTLPKFYQNQLFCDRQEILSPTDRPTSRRTSKSVSESNKPFLRTPSFSSHDTMDKALEIWTSIPQPAQWALAGLGAFSVLKGTLSFLNLLLNCFILSGKSVSLVVP